MTVDVALTGAAGDLVRWGQAASAAHALAQSLCRTKFVPEPFRGEDKVGDATAAILLGAEVGLSPISSLRALYVAKSGEPTMYSRTIVALVTARGHEVWTESEGDGRVTVAGRRSGSEHVERVTWTMERAKAAGLAGRNNVYRDHPAAMLYARAAADVARRIAPDVLLGIPEGLADETGPSAEPVEATVAVQRRAPRPPDVRQPEPAAVLGDSPAPDSNRVATPLSGEPVRTRPTDTVADVTDLAEAPDDEPEPEPPEPKITGPQRAKLHAEFNAAGMDRDAYMAWTRGQLARPDLETTNDVTVTEAGYLLDAIEAAKARRRTPEPPPEG